MAIVLRRLFGLCSPDLLQSMSSSIEQLVAMERCFIVNKQKVVIDRRIEWRPFTSGTCWMEQTALHYWHVCVVIGTVIEPSIKPRNRHFQVITNKHCAAQPVVYWRVNSLAPSLNFWCDNLPTISWKKNCKEGRLDFFSQGPVIRVYHYITVYHTAILQASINTWPLLCIDSSH